ncbi:hypothetical protein [Parachlamydia sp. AcF125]|uniref:hypothetical protein n=1 Tax=Parachlamydia sp. AcF125 TaxID=2795736 RepID=UPI001BC94E82|nr:hypothetical protein [Parachlamydia sp. AcF125]MBS4168169.1 hypothetical protein [Parachlamydia sp. AcF125]
MGPDNLSSIRDADRYRSEGPARKLLSEKDLKVTPKDEAREDSQKKQKNVADKGKFAKAVESVNLKANQEEDAQIKTAVPSLFDLARGDKSKEAEQGTGIQRSLPQQGTLPDEKRAERSDELFVSRAKAEAGAGIDSKKKHSQPLAQELPNQPLVNPMVAKTELPSIYTPIPPLVQPVNMLERIKQIVDQIGQIDLYSIKEGGKTETAITLSGIGKMFDGARVVISSFDNAKNEFNITFENLTQQAKNLLDLPKNQEALMHALAQRGEWIVHQVTTTTISEHRPYLGDTQLAKEGRHQEEGGFEGQGRQKRPRG